MTDLVYYIHRTRTRALRQKYCSSVVNHRPLFLKKRRPTLTRDVNNNINQSKWYHWCLVDRTNRTQFEYCDIFCDKSSMFGFEQRLPNGYRKCLTDILDDGATYEDVPRHPSELFVDFLFLASQADARDPATLKRYGITHVVNCVGNSTSRRNPYKASTGVIKYYQFSSDDCPSYPMIAQHFDPVRNFLDEAYESGGRALVHCKAGVNRSATLCVAYMMLKKKMTLLKAVAVAKRKRIYVLTNTGFRQQLIDFAKNNDLVTEKNGKSNRGRHARNSY